MMNASNSPPLETPPVSVRNPRKVLPQPDWMQFLGDDEWHGFSEIILAARDAKIDLLSGGALGVSAYMPLRRRTKDLDFYVMPEDRHSLIALLSETGFHDLYHQVPYDREWIYRSVRHGVIADVIWSFANKRALVDEAWFRNSHSVVCADTLLRVVAPEELIWAKLFVLQRERCDWPDLLNLLYYAGPTLDWERLRARLGPDRLLLDGLLAVFTWMCPERLTELSVGSDPPCDRENRAGLLDGRPWFLPAIAASSEGES